jgi:hypothetical protein
MEIGSLNRAPIWGVPLGPPGAESVSRDRPLTLAIIFLEPQHLSIGGDPGISFPLTGSLQCSMLTGKRWRGRSRIRHPTQAARASQRIAFRRRWRPWISTGASRTVAASRAMVARRSISICSECSSGSKTFARRSRARKPSRSGHAVGLLPAPSRDDGRYVRGFQPESLGRRLRRPTHR